MKSKSRRNFIKTIGIAAPTALIGNRVYSKSLKSSKAASNMPIGLASYSTRKFSLEETIEMANRIKLKDLTLKSMHLPLDASPQEIQTAMKKIKAAGIRPYAGSVIYMKSKEQVDNAFEYTKTAGMPMIVGVPNYDLLDYVEEKVKAYDIVLAIHNHGPDNLPYPKPEVAYEKVKNRDKRMGLCMDIGHVTRSGDDPVPSIHNVADRLYDLHVWDSSSAEKNGKAVPAGLGVIDFPGVIKALMDVNYKGVINIEYGSEGDDPFPGIAHTAGYIRGIQKIM
jgi:inosose dehydratase